MLTKHHGTLLICSGDPDLESNQRFRALRADHKSGQNWAGDLSPLFAEKWQLGSSFRMQNAFKIFLIPIFLPKKWNYMPKL